MESKTRKIIFLIAGELLLLGTLSVATFAWFITSWEPTHDITLTSGESTIMVDLNAYTSEQTKPLHDALSDSSSNDSLNPTPVAWNRVFDRNVPSSVQYHNVSEGNASSTDAISVTFDSDIVSHWSYEEIYDLESSADLYGFPALYLELDYMKDAMDGFIKVSLADVSYVTPSPSGFAGDLTYFYRYATFVNEKANPSENGFASCAEILFAKDFQTLSDGASVDLYTASDFAESSYADLDGAISSQCYVNAFPLQYENTINETTYDAYYFSKATVLEIRPDPIALLRSVKEYAETSGTATDYSFGVSFTLTFEFSNTPFLSVEGN